MIQRQMKERIKMYKLKIPHMIYLSYVTKEV